MNLPPLVLASASPRRAALLRELNLDFHVVPSEATEVHEEQLTARELALWNAHRKCRVVARRFPDHLVMGADTLVHLDGRIFGKPGDLAEARRMLQQLQSATHEVVTGICLVHALSGREALFSECSQVRFKALTSEQIDAYLSLVNPLDKAGAYAIQERGELLVEHVNGSYSNVVGLPLERVRAELVRWSHSLLDS